MTTGGKTTEEKLRDAMRKDEKRTHGLLAYNELLRLTEEKIIDGCKPEQVNGSSIDITLGRFLLVESLPQNEIRVLSYANRDALSVREVDLSINPGGFLLMPGAFILAQSREVFYLPSDLSAEYKLKSSMARIGLNHLNAGWCDSFWSGSVLTLELHNTTQSHAIQLRMGDPIGQMVFFRHAPVPEESSYKVRGRYNNDKTVSGIKE